MLKFMNVKEAVIIKTNSNAATEMAKKTREVLKRSGQDVVLVPHGVNAVFITFEREELVVLLQRDDEVLGVKDLDIATGFDSVAECKEYAKLVNIEAGLPEDNYDQDVWDID